MIRNRRNGFLLGELVHHALHILDHALALVDVLVVSRFQDLDQPLGHDFVFDLRLLRRVGMHFFELALDHLRHGRAVRRHRSRLVTPNRPTGKTLVSE